MKKISYASFIYSVGIMRFVHALRYVRNRLWYGRVSDIGGVRIIVNHHGRVVLVRHWYAPGVWTLPGGGIERGESVEAAAVREVKEETGFTVTHISGTLGVYNGSYGKGDQVTVVYIDNPIDSMRFLPNLEIMERGLFDFDALPENISPANRRRIAEYLRGEKNITGISW